MSYETIQVTPIAGALGAEISGVDLSEPLGNQTFQEVHDALMENLVIFFRDQDITADQHKAFGARFGELQVHPFAPHLEDHPEIIVIENDEQRPSKINNWHTDVTFMQKPPLGSILHAQTVPEAGGDTMWANMYAAYDALSDKWQVFLSDLKAVHDFTHNFGKRLLREEGGYEKLKKAQQQMPPAVHPVVRTHPVSGRKGIFVNSAFTTHIDGMSQRESDAVLGFLYEHIRTPEFTCRFNWRKHSIAFWDNRCTQHYPIADYWPAERRMHRVTVNGDRPV
ncbi:MAG: taurine dioxygenase [Minwuiales bacterium]|nr:taurine dioxygenase [Minwuiales bacterium]